VQAVLAIPGLDTLRKYGDPAEVLTRKVAGVPLLVRVLATAARSGVDSVLVIWPEDVDRAVLESCSKSEELKKLRLDTLFWNNGWTNAFDPGSAADWESILTCLEERFLWLPWNWATHKRALMELHTVHGLPVTWHRPAILERSVVLKHTSFHVSLGRQAPGVSVTSAASIPAAERFLVSNSGKPLDGIYSTFNRRLCRPVVRLLTHTRVTANALTLAGMVAAILGALLFARGSYVASVAGALLFFASGLFDEMDGMIARLKFRESAFGTWFEGFVDNATYLLIFLGIIVGLHHRFGNWASKYGAALIVGCVFSVVAIAIQRKLATAPDRPHEYAGKMKQLLESDSSNLASRVMGQLSVFVKKAVVIHYLLLFTVLNALPVFLWLAALGSNLTWIFALYFTRRFFMRPPLDVAGIQKAA
jgi:phosphatidylglycerophosphate synthase